MSGLNSGTWFPKYSLKEEERKELCGVLMSGKTHTSLKMKTYELYRY